MKCMLLVIAYFYPLTLVPESKAELSLHFLELEMQNFAFIRRILFCGISSVTPEKWSYLTAQLHVDAEDAAITAQIDA